MEQKKLNFYDSERQRVIDGQKLTTYVKEITSANVTEIEVGTTGFCGGDSGHGCRTYLRIKDLASTDMRVNVDGESAFCKECNQIEIVMGGDCELETLVDALRFAIETLEHQGAHGVTMFERSNKEIKQDAFRDYLYELIHLYARTKSLRGMTEIRNKYKIAGLTKIQFFEFNLNEAARDKNFFIDKDLSNKMYDFITRSENRMKTPDFKYESKK